MLKPASDYFSTLQKQISESLWPQRRVLMVGPSGGGKTVILYQLKLGEPVTTIPTTGFNVETLTPTLGVVFTVCEVGSYWNNRGAPWRHDVQGTDAVICVVDSSDVEQVEEARSTLWRMYEENDEQLRGSALLVFANKQDCRNAMAVAEIRDRLELETRAGGWRWHIRGCVATTGEGLLEGMEWLATQSRERNTLSRQR